MRSKIAFVLFLIGCAGSDSNFTVSAILVLFSIFALWHEGRKIDAPTNHSRSVYK